MTISKKLLLATAMLATCVSSIGLHAETSKTEFLGIISACTVGPAMVATNASKLLLINKLKKITPAPESLVKQIKTSQKYGRIGLVAGSVLSLIPTGIVLTKDK